MSIGWILVAVALMPLVLWLVVIAVMAARRWWRRRGDEKTRRLRLARILGRGGRGDVVVVPTTDVDLPEHTVIEVAAGAGCRLVGYERADTLLRRRVGVFVRVGGPVDAVIRGPRDARTRVDSVGSAGRASVSR